MTTINRNSPTTIPEFLISFHRDFPPENTCYPTLVLGTRLYILYTRHVGCRHLIRRPSPHSKICEMRCHAWYLIQIWAITNGNNTVGRPWWSLGIPEEAEKAGKMVSILGGDRHDQLHELRSIWDLMTSHHHSSFVTTCQIWSKCHIRYDMKCHQKTWWWLRWHDHSPLARSHRHQWPIVHTPYRMNY